MGEAAVLPVAGKGRGRGGITLLNSVILLEKIPGPVETAGPFCGAEPDVVAVQEDGMDPVVDEAVGAGVVFPQLPGDIEPKGTLIGGHPDTAGVRCNGHFSAPAHLGEGKPLPGIAGPGPVEQGRRRLGRRPDLSLPDKEGADRAFCVALRTPDRFPGDVAAGTAGEPQMGAGPDKLRANAQGSNGEAFAAFHRAEGIGFEVEYAQAGPAADPEPVAIPGQGCYRARMYIGRSL